MPKPTKDDPAAPELPVEGSESAKKDKRGPRPSDTVRADPSALPSARSFHSLMSFEEDAPEISLHPVGDDSDIRSIEPSEERYELLNRIGEGGMGEVFLAYDRDLKRRLAMKTVRPSNDGTLWRFYKEAQVMGQLVHPNIVTVFELGMTKGERPYYTMPFVQGETLLDVLFAIKNDDSEYDKRYSLTKLVQLFLQVTLAIDYAHSRGVVHRDIKPANIMLGPHGEVLLLDWGVAKLMSGFEGPEPDETGQTVAGMAVGTPTYMAPEQVMGEDVDPRTDVYALGIVLYEILAQRPPFEGGVGDVMRAHLETAPTPPRKLETHWRVPLELERICLKALEKDPANRHETARALHDDVQQWLEMSSERQKRRERADELAKKGRELLDRYYEIRKKIRSTEQALAEEKRLVKDWQPISEKTHLIKAEDEIEATRLELSHTASDVVMKASAAIGQDNEHAQAREILAEYYWDQFQIAEENSDRAQADYFRSLVTAFHDGKYLAELKGDGELKLKTQPPGAELSLFRLGEKALTLSPVEQCSLRQDESPQSLPMGSYLVRAKKDGFAETLYPVFIGRNRSWSGTVPLYRHQDIGEGFCLVARGPFRVGGDAQTQGWCLPSEEPDLPDFLISIHPVTFGEYLEFLNDPSVRDAEPLRAPRANPTGGSFLERAPSGRWTLPTDKKEQGWTNQAPVVSVSWHDAIAYCRWRSIRDGVTYRLPSELEWEKASRGVDGRWFPWGHRFDPTLCNMSLSRKDGARLVSTSAYANDASVYGVRGTAGNARDWTSTKVTATSGEKVDSRVVRGGAYNLPEVISRSANRFWLPADFVANYVGFRLVKDLT